METEKRKQQKAKAQRTWYKKNKEKAKKLASERYAKNKDEINAKRRQNRIDNPEEVRAKARSRYDPIKNKERSWRAAGMKDMNHKRYLLMLKKQSYCCDICGIHQDEFKRNLDVDHDHNTGEVRGLLCTPCNSGIGKLKDSINMLEKAINYLKRYE
jgi:flagellar biosynthesis GTPase FlhF